MTFAILSGPYNSSALVNILKEKQKIEEDRLAELKRARKKEQMENLRVRVTDILFRKKQKT